MTRRSVASEAGRRPAVPEIAASALDSAEERAGMLWAAAQLRGRSVLVVATERVTEELPLLFEAGIDDVVVLPADGLTDTVLPPDTPRLDGTLDALPATAGAADALLWLSVPDDPQEATTRLDRLMALLPPNGRVVLGFSPAGQASLELIRTRFPRAHSAASRTMMAATVSGGGGARGSGRRYLTTAPVPESDAQPVTVTCDVAAYHEWVRLVAEQDARMAELERRLVEAEQSARERAELQELLLTAETELAQVPLLREALDELRHDRDRMRQERDGLLADLARARRVLAEVVGSLSWRMTRPLRALKPRRR
jgi:hypothetical protein